MRSSTKMGHKPREIRKKMLMPLLVLLLIGGCSSSKKSDDADVDMIFGTKGYADAIVSKVGPKWFKGAKRFNLVEREGEAQPHFFFDVNPEINLAKKTLNFVVVTPGDSSSEYGIDLASGQHYFKRPFCEQKDIWKKSLIEIKNPPYTIGVVPRLLDQLGLPQKIIVFGSGKYYQQHFKQNYFDARIIGGVIEQVCPRRSCLEPGEWKSRLVLVGVQKGHEAYEKVQTITDLQKKVDWPLVQAFFENGHGRNLYGGKYYPAYRMGAGISAGQSLKFLETHSIFFNVAKMKSMRRSCYKLYDLLWKDMGYISKAEKSARTTRDIKKKAENLQKLYSDTNKLFYKRFIRSFKKYSKEYKTCSRYIYPASINWNKKRHWFFAYYSAFHKLHDLGYSYLCRSRVWVKNSYMNEKEKAISMKKELLGCSEKGIDTAFENAILKFGFLEQEGHNYYRYIDYDNGSFGTHNKMYSWVKVSNKHLECTDSESQKKMKKKMTKKIFPKDISWERRASQGKTKLGEIIY